MISMIVLFITVVMVNAFSSVVVERGVEYTASYSYCAQWQAAYKSQQCVRYASGTERRVPVKREGILWNYETYEIVR
jgi:hypothetical protein